MIDQLSKSDFTPESLDQGPESKFTSLLLVHTFIRLVLVSRCRLRIPCDIRTSSWAASACINKYFGSSSSCDTTSPFCFFFFCYRLMPSQLIANWSKSVRNHLKKCFHTASELNHGSVWSGPRTPLLVDWTLVHWSGPWSEATFQKVLRSGVDQSTKVGKDQKSLIYFFFY